MERAGPVPKVDAARPPTQEPFLRQTATPAPPDHSRRGAEMRQFRGLMQQGPAAVAQRASLRALFGSSGRVGSDIDQPLQAASNPASARVASPVGFTAAIDGTIHTPVVQMVKMTKPLKTAVEKWVKKTWGEDADASDVIAWFADASISEADVITITKRKLDDWWGWAETVDPKEVDPADARVGSSEEKKKVAVDPLKDVRAKVTFAGLDPNLFTTGELQSILAGSALGWDAAIQNVNQQRIQRIANAAAHALRLGKYQAAKTAGDAVFNTVLLQKIWDMSFAIMMGSNPNPNDAVTPAFSDADILAADAVWHDHADIAPALGSPPTSLSVTDIHVPRGRGVIEDKSTRPVNPDPTRGRQADFKSTWGGVEVNVHVDSTVPH